MLKDSSIVSVIGVGELLCVAQALGRSNATSPQMLVLAALFYLALSLACSVLGRWAERALKNTGAPELRLDRAHGH
jgi:ABC-type amino acid transport system permease subunit